MAVIDLRRNFYFVIGPCFYAQIASKRLKRDFDDSKIVSV